MAGLLETVRDRYQKALKTNHPMDHMWDWAVSGDTAKDREDRFDALQKWARGKEDNADTRHQRHFWDAAAEAYQRKERANREVRKKQEEERRKDENQGSGPGTTTYDGRTVPNWMIPELNYARSHGWNGSVVSGVRTPWYSQQLCYAMCGAPSCPGRCAGVNSNHNATPPVTDGEGAIDVTDYYTFKRIVEPRGKLFNRLGAADPVHFSRSGH